jgi:hypothetical protein
VRYITPTTEDQTNLAFHKFEVFFAEELLKKIFSFESEVGLRLTSRENSRLEFKESFSLGSSDSYSKTGAAFANAQGGYIVFGVKDSPRELVGLQSNNFETFDSAKFTQALNERFSPEIEWESHVCEIRGLKTGLIYFAESARKPVMCTRDSGVLKQGAIFYRYRGQSQTIRYPELRRILDEEKSQERDLWFKQLRKIAEIGVGHVGILDLHSGEVSGSKGKFFISDDLLPKLQFLREGHFVQNDGAPALRLIGDVQSVEGPVLHSAVRVPTALREPEIIGAFIKRESVLSPTDYIKSICFEQSQYFPIYFFIHQTNQSVEETIDVLSALEVRGQNRDKVVSRLRMEKEGLSIGVLKGSGAAATERRVLLEKVREKTVKDEDIWSLPIRFFEALTHTDSENFSETHIFDLLMDHVLPKLNQLKGLPLSAFRKALSHLDIIFYRSKIS